MPLRLVPPSDRTPNYTIRGTHLGVSVYRSAKTTDRATARKALKKIERDIERGAFSDKPSPTFASAITSYVRNGGEARFLAPLLAYFKERPLSEIDQAAIDEAAAVLYPNGTASTRNRQVYTPVSSILKHAGVEFNVKRPKGHAGKKRVDWLTVEDAARIFRAADKIDQEFCTFLVFLCYTGCRLSDALDLEVKNIHLQDCFAYIPDTKNGEDRAVALHPLIVSRIASHPRGLNRAGTVFRFRKNGYLYNLLKATKRKAGPDLAWVTFHTFCHTWATWMRRYAGLDAKGLVGTGRWKDEKSAARYAHVVVSEESQKAMLLPAPQRKK